MSLSYEGWQGPGPAPSPADPVAAGALPLPAAALVPPMGWRVAGTGEVLSGPALVGRQVLFNWPDKSWVRGRVVRVSRSAGFSHVVHYGPQSSLGALAVVSLLDAASHGSAGRWPGGQERKMHTSGWGRGAGYGTSVKPQPCSDM